MKNNRWAIVFFLAGCGAINYTDRAAFALASPYFTKDFNIGPAELGILFSAFSIGYAMFNFVGGVASDRFGAKRVFTVALAMWSIFCASIAFTFNFTSMLAARVLFGASEGPFGALVNKISNNWFTREQAASAVGIGNAGNPFGAMIAGPIVGFIAATYGWRYSFVIFGLIGLAMAGVWAVFAAEAPPGGPVNTANQAGGHGGGHGEGAKLPFSYYVKQPSILITAFAFFAINYMLYFFLSWFPKYLVDALHMSLADMSIITVIPWALGIVGLAGGGFLTDFAAKHMDRTLSRKLVLGGFLGISSVCIAFAGMVSSVTSAVALVSGAVLFMYLASAAPWIIVQDMVEPAHVGSVSGFNHMLANLGGFFGPLVTGFIVQATGAYTSAFVLAGVIGIVSVIGVFVILRPPVIEQGVPDAEEASAAAV
jgi:MFS family permease